MARPNKELIDPAFQETIDMWVSDACPPGGFIEAVLSNDLREAIARGDDAAIDNLPHIVAYLYNDCPSGCWGSPLNMKAWRGMSQAALDVRARKAGGR